jgi:ubiquinone/menaquinone biosynthesis C-methylase UbiE
MSTTPPKEYVLGTSDAELQRLGLQHKLWSAQALALWERAGFAPGQTIIDLGCGPGFATFDLAVLLGSTGRVIAVDESPRFLEHLRTELARRGLHNVETVESDVQKLSLPESTADGAYARWVLCFLKEPESAIAGVARALRRGGVFAIQDYFNYEALSLAPRSRIMTRVVRAVGESWRARGGDPDFVGRLPALCARSGLVVREIRPLLRVARPGSLLWEWPTTFFRNFVPVLVQNGFLTAAEQQEFEQEWANRTRDPNTFWFAPPVFDVIAEKA